jgi:hypothetical protein
MRLGFCAGPMSGATTTATLDAPLESETFLRLGLEAGGIPDLFALSAFFFIFFFIFFTVEMFLSIVCSLHFTPPTTD